MTAWLLTWLWQGTALSLLLLVLWRCVPRVSAATRYPIWWTAFAALALIGVQSSPAMLRGTDPSMNAAAADRAVAVLVRPWPAWTVSAILFVWLAGALVRLVRILPSLHALYRLKDGCSPVAADLEAELPLWREARVRGRRTRLMICEDVSTASVLGLHDPYIVFPPALVNDLSAADLDLVVLHEFGHVQRRDDWMRLIQALIEAALWIHPAASVIARELNLEREVACDDWVVAHTKAPLAYVACLSRVAERQRRLVNPALTPALIRARRDLLRRIDRLMKADRPVTRRMSRAGAAVAVVAIAGFVVSFRSLPLIAERVEMEFAAHPRAADMAVVRAAPPPASAVAVVQSVASVHAYSRSRVVDSPVVTSAPASAIADQAETQEPDVPVLEMTRSFPALSSSPPALDRPPTVSTTMPWQRAADAGSRLGETTARTGSRLGDVFTRLGSTAASSFRP